MSREATLLNTEDEVMVKPGTREWDKAIWAAGAAGNRPDWADVMWYGVDAIGCVGMFSSAGPGPIPRSVFHDLDAYNALSEYLGGLPVVGKPELLIRYKRTTDWLRAAERGLFAFDYQFDGGRPNGYQLVARPAALLSLTDLPEWVQAELAEARLEGESFAASAGRLVDLSGVRCGLVA